MREFACSLCVGDLAATPDLINRQKKKGTIFRHTSAEKHVNIIIVKKTILWAIESVFVENEYNIIIMGNRICFFGDNNDGPQPERGPARPKRHHPPTVDGGDSATSPPSPPRCSSPPRNRSPPRTTCRTVIAPHASIVEGHSTCPALPTGSRRTNRSTAPIAVDRGWSGCSRSLYMLCPDKGAFHEWWVQLQHKGRPPIPPCDV